MDTEPTYTERLRVPLVWAAAALLVAVLLAAEVHGGAGGWRAWVPYAVLPPATLLGVVLASRRRVRLADGVLHVPGARAPVSAFGAPQVLDREALRRRRGPEADARAWVACPAWVKEAVLLAVTDPEDETPCWVVGTRRPEQLTAALADAAARP